MHLYAKEEGVTTETVTMMTQRCARKPSNGSG